MGQTAKPLKPLPSIDWYIQNYSDTRECRYWSRPRNSRSCPTSAYCGREERNPKSHAPMPSPTVSETHIPLLHLTPSTPLLIKEPWRMFGRKTISNLLRSSWVDKRHWLRYPQTLNLLHAVNLLVIFSPS